MTEQLKKKIQDKLDILQPRSQKIMAMRFGLNGYVSHTLEEVGMQFGLTRERIRQIEAKSLEIINHSYEQQ